MNNFFFWWFWLPLSLFLIGLNSIGRDDARAARLASPLGRNGHTNLADAWTKFCTLEGILLKRYQETFVVIKQTTITFRELFETYIKVLTCLNYVAHLTVPLRDGNNPISQFPNIPSNASCLGKSLLSHHVLALLLLRESDGSCHDVTSALHARHVRPYPETWSDWLGNLLYLLSSYLPWDLLFAAKVQQNFETTILLQGKDERKQPTSYLPVNIR